MPWLMVNTDCILATCDVEGFKWGERLIMYVCMYVRMYVCTYVCKYSTTVLQYWGVGSRESGIGGVY
jgi:hypothetical protein